jgi:hypothetical protein
MKIKYTILVAAILAAAMTVTSCGKNTSTKSSDTATESSAAISEADGAGDTPVAENGDSDGISDEISGGDSVEGDAENDVDSENADTSEDTEEQIMEADPDAVPESGAAPVLSASSVSGAAGETVDVTISITGADKQWAMCGVHVTYDEQLTCVASESDPKTPVYTKGDAVNNISGFVTMLQVGDDRNDYLIENKQSAVFFAAVDSTNNGGDGDIVTYQFTIPDDAQSGTVYEIGFYYRDGDMFLDAEQDTAMQDYAFSHYQKGTITVK